jgi:predicted metal-binding protein
MALNEMPQVLGRPKDEAVVRADLERYRQLALYLGAADAVILPAEQVPVDARVRLKCVVPRCLRAGETPNCPPNAPSLDVVREAFDRFSWVVLFKRHVEPLADYAPGTGRTTAEKRQTLAFHGKTNEIVCEVERQAYTDGYHLAMGFGGGSCKDYLCQGMICQFLDSGRCRFPHRSRPAMEAMGIDVLSLINTVGWKAYALAADDLDQIPCGVSVGLVFIC